MRPEQEETGLSGRALKALLRYLYTGELDWLKLPEECEQIIKVFDYFGFAENEEQKAVHHHLFEHCCEVLHPPESSSSSSSSTHGAASAAAAEGKVLAPAEPSTNDQQIDKEDLEATE